jgi:hypothetical protein
MVVDVGMTTMLDVGAWILFISGSLYLKLIKNNVMDYNDDDNMTRRKCMSTHLAVLWSSFSIPSLPPSCGELDWLFALLAGKPGLALFQPNSTRA